MAILDPTPPRPTAINVIEATRAAYDLIRKSERKVTDLLEPRIGDLASSSQTRGGPDLAGSTSE
jgi:hypothetical protein